MYSCLINAAIWRTVLLINMWSNIANVIITSYVLDWYKGIERQETELTGFVYVGGSEISPQNPPHSSNFTPRSEKLFRSFVLILVMQYQLGFEREGWHFLTHNAAHNKSEVINTDTANLFGTKNTSPSPSLIWHPHFSSSFVQASIFSIRLIFVFIIIYWLLSLFSVSCPSVIFSYIVLFLISVDAIMCIFVACLVISPCWGSSIEGEGEGSRGEHLRQPLTPLPCCHPPSVTSDCPFSTHHTHLDEPPHKDWGLL